MCVVFYRVIVGGLLGPVEGWGGSRFLLVDVWLGVVACCRLDCGDGAVYSNLSIKACIYILIYLFLIPHGFYTSYVSGNGKAHVFGAPRKK